MPDEDGALDKEATGERPRNITLRGLAATAATLAGLSGGAAAVSAVVSALDSTAAHNDTVAARNLNQQAGVEDRLAQTDANQGARIAVAVDRFITPAAQGSNGRKW
ncbi:MAG TPA: hypothetical protein VF020_21135 [Chthoniobacterales bacterium]